MSKRCHIQSRARPGLRLSALSLLLAGMAVALLATAGFPGTAEARSGRLTAPTNVVATVSGNAITVTWTDGHGALGHLLILFKSDFSGDPLVANAQGSSHTFSGVAPGEYLAVVVAIDANDYKYAISDPVTISTASGAVSPDLRHIDEKRFMLSLINAERKKAGVGVVTLGENIAAQLHAESALKNCFSSHWGLDGLKPYMRYSLAGGYQSNGENGSGLDYCIKASDGYSPNSSINQEIREAMDGWMRSPGHRRNILDPTHRKVSIGIAWDRYNTAMYQHFEGDYIEYDRLPTISNGVLSLSVTTRNGAQFSGNLGQTIFYDPPPHELTRGQVARTYCYDNGRTVASLRRPLTGGFYWSTNTFTTTYNPCPSPYDVPASTPGPRSPAEAHQAWQDAYSASQARTPQSITVPWITALEWQATATSFAVRADISDVLGRFGSGVYTVMLWGEIGGESAVLSQYSIFHGLMPPDTYRRAATQ